MKVELHEWNAETMRLTLFPKEGVEAAGLSWWQSVIGEPPESHTLRPREGKLEESGRIADGQCNLTLQCEARRIDWLFTPSISPEQELTEFPSFAKLPEALALYRRLLLPWLVHAPSCKRLAFGCVVTHPAQDRETGYDWISALLPSVRLDPKGSSEFSYSINRRRATRTDIGGLTINRLSKWSVVKLRPVFIPPPEGEEPLPASEVYACRLELDINTVPEFPGDFSDPVVESVINELIDLGLEIAIEGDLP
jgi:hypothetical protein